MDPFLFLRCKGCENQNKVNEHESPRIPENWYFIKANYVNKYLAFT